MQRKPYKKIKEFYVYVLVDPAACRIFYVGKGKDNRVDNHEQEARRGCACHKCRKIRKMWRTGGEVVKHIVLRTTNEQEAFDYEARLITKIGLGRLTNVRPGGGQAQLPLQEI